MFILSILSLYNTILCFSLCPYFIINEYELACDWATYININGSLQVMYDAIGVILQCTLLLAYSLYRLSCRYCGIWYILLDTFGLYQYQLYLSLALYTLFLFVCIMTQCGTGFCYGTLLILVSMLLIPVTKLNCV